MARFRSDEVDKYGGQGGGGFFGLANDGDSAIVRFMYNNEDDIEGYSVHEIKKPGSNGRTKKQYVNCLREYKDPVDKCPFCAAQMPTIAKVFIPIYDEETGKTKTWDRGKTMFPRLASLCKRYAKKKPLVSTVFEIERHGAAQDTSTTYEIYKSEEDYEELTLEDLPKAPGTANLVWEKTAEDMEYYLQEGQFPPTGDGDDEEEEEERPTRRPRSKNGGHRREREAF